MAGTPARHGIVRLVGADGALKRPAAALLTRVRSGNRYRPRTSSDESRVTRCSRRRIATSAPAGDRLLGFYCTHGPAVLHQRIRILDDGGRSRRGGAVADCARQALAAGEPCSALWPAIVGAYFPLHTLSNARGFTREILAAMRGGVACPAGEGAGRGTPDQGHDSRSDHYRRRSVARGARTIRGKPLPALDQTRTAGTTRHSRTSAGAGRRRPHCRLRHRPARHRVRAAKPATRAFSRSI